MIGKNIKTQSGFTLIELTIAMAVFTFMLSIILVGFLGVVKTHESGVVQRSTQQNARLAMDQITKAIQRSATSTSSIIKSPPAEIDKVCITSAGQNLVLEVKSVHVSSALDVNSLTLGVISAGSCVSAATYTRLTDNNVSVVQFKTNEIPPSGSGLGVLGITLTVASAFGLQDLNTSQTACSSGSGTQFCSVTTIQSTAVLKGGLE
jgi:prepilin-type N-terminal cleavage/methylation domain-containing protein